MSELFHKGVVYYICCRDMQVCPTWLI